MRHVCFALLLSAFWKERNMSISGIVALPYNISANRCSKIFNLFWREDIAEASMEQKFLPGNL